MDFVNDSIYSGMFKFFVFYSFVNTPLFYMMNFRVAPILPAASTLLKVVINLSIQTDFLISLFSD